jgi:signal transduction histidine kinase
VSKTHTLQTRSYSLQARLTMTYAVALAAGLIVLAVISLTVIGEQLASALDSRLAVSTRAFIGSLTIEHGTIKDDLRTRQRLRSILSPQQNAAIVRHDGTVLMQSGAAPAAVVRFAATVSDRPTFASIRTEGIPLRALAAPVPDAPAATVVLWRPIDFITDYVRDALTVFGIAGVVILLAASWVGSLVARRGLEPLRTMADLASEIEARDLTRRLVVVRDDELGRLASAFNRMLDRLQLAFEQQRQFTADVSHELRAPLAVIRAEVELSLRRPREVSSYLESLASIQNEVAHLEALIDMFLAVARADAGAADLRDIDASEVTSRAIRRMVKFADAKGVRIDETIASDTIVAGEPEQFERILVSLFHNAIKFCKEGGTVAVAVAPRRGGVEIRVRDDGPGFSDEALAHAFDRFWRDAARHPSGASGLGLTIAKSAIERWGGRIHLANAPHGGGEISITLPAH